MIHQTISSKVTSKRQVVIPKRLRVKYVREWTFVPDVPNSIGPNYVIGVVVTFYNGRWF